MDWEALKDEGGHIAPLYEWDEYDIKRNFRLITGGNSRVYSENGEFINLNRFIHNKDTSFRSVDPAAVYAVSNGMLANGTEFGIAYSEKAWGDITVDNFLSYKELSDKTGCGKVAYVGFALASDYPQIYHDRNLAYDMVDRIIESQSFDVASLTRVIDYERKLPEELVVYLLGYISGL